MAATIGTGRDNPSFREKLNEEKDRGMTLIHSIVRMIKQMRARGENPSVKGFEKEARKFQEVIERIRDDESRVVRNSINSGRSSDVDDELTAGLLDGQLQEEAKLTHLEAKKNQIKNLEQDVTELAGMFVDLQGLVNEQQATVDQITVHVEEAKEYTNNAATELEKVRHLHLFRRSVCHATPFSTIFDPTRALSLSLLSSSSSQQKVHEAVISIIIIIINYYYEAIIVRYN